MMPGTAHRGAERLCADVSFVCPTSKTYVAAAERTPGDCSDTREKEKHRAFRGHGEAGLGFRAFAVETYGRLGHDAMRLLRDIAQVASSTGRVNRARLLSSAFQQISVAVCIGNAEMIRRNLDKYVKASGRIFSEGLPLPQDELAD